MSAQNVRTVLKPQGIAAILGLGMLSVATVSLAVTSMGLSIPLAGQIVSAAVGVVGGVKAVLASR